MEEFLGQFVIQFTRSVPLFILIGVGYALPKWCGFTKTASNAIAKFAFNVSLTSMLFRIMASQHKNTSTADPMLLVAFFGAALVLLLIGRMIGIKALKLNPVEASIFGTGTVFCNNGLLGLPLAIVMLGDTYLPAIACVLTFNAMILWTAVSVLVELSQGSGKGVSIKMIFKSTLNVFKNPLIISIFTGALWNLTKIDLPYVVDEPLRMLGASATPLSLIAVGMGLAEYGIGTGFKVSAILSAMKLTIQPIAVFFVSMLIGLGPIETTAVVFLAALPCGVNVYLMTKQFQVMEGEVANAMLITTLAASLTMPFAVTLLKHLF